MTRLPLTLACGDYDRTRALATGAVRPDGVELNVITLEPEVMFYRMARFPRVRRLGARALHVHRAPGLW